MGWTSLGEVLLNQIRYSDSLGRSPGFGRSMLQDQSLCTILNLFAPCIVDAEIEAITSNYRLRLASTDVNPTTLNKFTFETLDRIQQTSAPFLSFLLKITAGTGDRRTI